MYACQTTMDAHTIAVDAERCSRTLCIKGIPVGLPQNVVYEILFGEPASPHYQPLQYTRRSSGRVLGYAVPPHPYIQPSRWMLRGVRVHQPAYRAVYCSAFVEFCSKAAAVRTMLLLEGRDVSAWGGQILQVEWAKEPIVSGHWADFDQETHRPCLYGLCKAECSLLDTLFRLRQVPYPPALRPMPDRRMKG
ncbi:hypothetical protein ABL78_8545 [Leptomonas seymouri]|uniref:Uncharacterized protein n=1 Tax=Leptomonas seymouri TaxID=5684 RepID=A0A0N1HSI7_LEPSE|nr:hypothetical protein ABL78_8545 [Leptomonas seymouri]|eukprot:KPI82445.1 hypothetical protein ABL78_8545 [Leptomonas seymouri]